MQYIKLQIRGISYSQTQTGAYALILEEVEGEYKLPIIVGAFEAQSIAILLEKDIRTTGSKPMTHDLFICFVDAFKINIKNVVIHRLVDGIFSSSIFCECSKGREVVIDARVGDAVAIAIGAGVDIFTTSQIIQKAGMLFEEDLQNESLLDYQESENEKKENIWAHYSLSELENLLKESLQKEDYENAANLRDEIKRRTQQP